MKKIMLITLALAVTAALGTAFADMKVLGGRDGGHEVLFNGITDFSGKSYDIVPEIGIAAPAETRVAEGYSAGGARDEMGTPLYNGVTDFTGRSYDDVPDSMNKDLIGKGAIEGVSAGGIRDDGEPQLYNGATDFTGKSNDAAPELF